MVFKKPFGAKTSRYGPHELGYRRATKSFYKVMQNLTLNNFLLFYIFSYLKKVE
jgi:hypothetical protein